MSTTLRRLSVLAAFSTLVACGSAAQVELAASSDSAEMFSSAMPILVLDNGGFGAQAQTDGTIAGNVQLFESSVLSLSSPAGLKLRGNSSAEFPKKSYSIELHDDSGSNRSVSLLGMAKAADWALVSPWQYDPSYLRNAYVYALSNSLGLWAPRTRFTEVFIKQDGTPLSASHYAGIGVLTERIKIDKDLVNIASLSASDVAGEAVTGGYILKFDPKDEDEFGWVTDRGIPAQTGTAVGTMLVLAAPKAAKLAPAQQDYITGYVQAFENALFADRDSNWATREYLSYIDRASWIDFHLLQVLVKNPDGLVRSAYFNKDRGGKLKAGPVWDFDRAMASADPRSQLWDEWNEPTQSAQLWETGWWGVLARDPDFIQAWIDRWQALRRDKLSAEKLTALANTLATQIDPDAATRDAARWPDNASRFGGTHRGEVDYLISWLTRRADWIDRQFVAAPVVVSTGSARQMIAPIGSTIAYTTDGSDPRASGGGVSTSALVATGTIVLPENATITARVHTPSFNDSVAGSPWSSTIVSSPGTVSSASSTATASLATLSTLAAVDGPNSRFVSSIVVSGTQPKTFAVRAVGPTLSLLGVADALQDPVVRVVSSTGTEVAVNSDWRSGNDVGGLSQISAATGAFPLADTARDAALVVSLEPGTYGIEVASASGGRGAVLAEIYAANDASAVKYVSARTVVGADEVVMGGVTVTGASTRRVIIRAVGPGLASPDAAADVTVAVYAGTRLVASNDDWSYSTIASEIASGTAEAGAFALPAGSKDAAVLMTLSPGTYTFLAAAKGATGGSMLIDVIELQ